MASTGKCQFCGATVTSDEKQCPGCGAANPNYVAKENMIITHPKTIEELKTYCAQKGMPLLRMRFFIDENYREPKAFGIYRDGDQFVVYKNKSDGSRSVRYHGPDEAYAVNELYTKLLDECHNRGIYPNGKPSGTTGTRSSNRSIGNKNNKWTFLIIAGIILLIMLFAAKGNTHKNDGYYRKNNTVYYRYGDSWYTQTYSDWTRTSSFPENDYTQYYEGNTFDSDWGGESFQSSDTYRSIKESEERERSSSNDNDYSSWDSSDTDWDSDW